MNRTSERPSGHETAGAASRWWLLASLVIATFLRCYVVWTHSEELTQDRDAYLAMARCLSEGRGLVDPNRLTPTAFRPPVYPIQLAGLMLIFPAAAAVAIGNLVWGATTVWATWHAGDALGLVWRKNLAALLVAVDPMLLQYSAQPMTEVTCAGLVSLLVCWIVRRDGPEPRRHGMIGLLFGLLVLCRPTFWPFAGLILAEWIVRMAFARKVTRAEGSTEIVFPWRVIAGTLLVTAPWVVRNQLVLGSPIVMTTHGGYTLLLANNPVFYDEVVDRGWGSAWSQPSFERWTAELLATLRAELGTDATELQRDRWQGRQARNFIQAAPGRFLRAVWYRIRCLWSPVPQSEAAGNTSSGLIQLVGWYYTAILLTFAVSVSWTTCRLVQGPQTAWWPLLALVLTVQSVHLVYWTNARMRAPIAPIISLFVATTKLKKSS